MKLIDKFLKKLNTSRNTFVTYVLTLISFYLAIDRIVEMLLMIFTGVSVSYWGPFMYTFALACPVFAFLFSGSSEFASSKNTKVTLFYTYVVGLYVIALSMFVQWINRGAWLLLISLPGYTELVTDYSELIKPALTSLAIYLPLVTFYSVFKFIRLGVGDSKDWTRSIWDYKGISLKDTKQGHGPFTCDLCVCNDFETGKKVQFVEKARYQSLLVVGGSGTGKTSLIIEPFVAKDIEKKAFYIATAKEMGYTALKTGIAVLNKPYDNEYLNQNFSLNMISPNSSKVSSYKSCMKKLIYATSDDKIIYRDLGLTYISPDFESISRILKVAKNYHVNVNLIDPNSDDSPGLNPFSYDNPLQTSIIISTVLKALHSSNQADMDLNLGVQANFATQAIENLSILLKVMYPRMHDDELPTLEDMLNAFNDFDIIQKMCEEMEKDEELSKKFNILLTYFKKNFYKESTYRQDTEKYVSSATTQLDNLLRYPGIRNILCKRTDNLNFDSALANGEFTLLCTRRGDLGAAAHTAFGLFFLLSMQYAVLRRPGIESTRIPHFLYIDEFSDFISDSTEPIFTLYRKYRVGSVISVQNLDQLNAKNNKYRKTIIANCAHKVVFGNNVPEDNDWWSKELGEKSKWSYSRSYDTAKGEYSANLSGIKNEKVAKYKPGKIQTIKFKQCIYKVRDSGGKSSVGIGSLNFIEAKYNEKQPVTNLNFAKFTNGMSDDNPESAKKKIKKNVIPTFVNDDDSEEELDPIRSSNFDSIFDNADEGDAIISPTNKKNKKNNN